MGYVPGDARWWLADCVIAITLEGKKRVVRQIDRLLVNAVSAESAYEEALELGRASSLDYRNEAGMRVRVRFLGLANVIVLHDGVEHGTESTSRRPSHRWHALVPRSGGSAS